MSDNQNEVLFLHYIDSIKIVESYLEFFRDTVIDSESYFAILNLLIY